MDDKGDDDGDYNDDYDDYDGNNDVIVLFKLC